jgi:lipopolysaccharide/colanic/teichoic acid biosynthesis glycosyltransferase
MYKTHFKRLLDFSIAFTVFIVSLPALFLVALMIYCFDNSSPLFVQPRPGLGRKIFYLVKFKTMSNAKDSNGRLLPDASRLTAMGKFIRSTSLDELPQLINVIKGDMSLIGPRPLLEKYLPLYSERQARRHEVRPGITGLAQVNGRNSISWPKRFELDVYYVDHLSFKLDVRILLLTIKKVFKREGINGANSVTMEAFKGNSDLG